MILPSLLLVATALAWSRGRVTPIVLSAVALGLVLTGFVQLDQARGTAFWIPQASGVLALLLGYALAARQTRFRVTESTEVRESRPADAAALAVFATVVLAFVAYHFIVGGFPLFSTNVEVARFDFTSSGVFGLPGRMFLFGLPFLVFFASAYLARHGGTVAQWTVRVVWLAYASAAVLAGFKGSVLMVLVVFLLVRASVGRPLHLRGLVAPKLMAVGAAAMLVALLIAFQYRSLQLSSPGEAVSYLADRLTIIAAEPGYVAIAELSGRDQPYIVNDFVYLLEKYTKTEISSEPTYPLELIVSARQAGLPLDGSTFIAPSTVGAFPSWYVDIGWMGATMAMLILGVLYAIAHAHAVRAAAPFSAALWGFAVYLIYIYGVNGGLAYWAVNGLAMAIMLTILWRLASWLVTGLNGTRGEARHDGRRRSRSAGEPL